MSLRRALLEIGMHTQMLSTKPVEVTIKLPDEEFVKLLQELDLIKTPVNYHRPIDIAGVIVTRDEIPPEGYSDIDFRHMGIDHK